VTTAASLMTKVVVVGEAEAEVTMQAGLHMAGEVVQDTEA